LTENNQSTVTATTGLNEISAQRDANTARWL